MGLGERLLRHAHRGHPQHGGAGEGHEHGAAGGMIHSPVVYDAMSHVLFLGLRGPVYRRLAWLTGARPGDAVLDVGCGSGAFTRALARRVGAGGSVVGIDPAPEMVAFASRRTPVGRAGADGRTSYAVMAAEQLSFADRSFDGVASMLAMHHVDAGVRADAVSAMASVVVPGGWVALIDARPARSERGRRAVRALLGDAMADNELEPVAELTRAAGLEDVEVVPVGPFLGMVRGRRRAG